MGLLLPLSARNNPHAVLVDPSMATSHTRNYLDIRNHHQNWKLIGASGAEAGRTPCSATGVQCHVFGMTCCC